MASRRQNEAVNIGRKVWTAVGLTCVGLGLVGVVVPGMPTTIFMILALYCFKRGSARFEKWLLEHPVFGPTLRDWEKYKGIRRKTKVVAVGTVWFFIGISLLILLKKPAVMAIVATTGALVTWYILSRPTIPDGVPIEGETTSVPVEDQAFLG